MSQTNQLNVESLNEQTIHFSSGSELPLVFDELENATTLYYQFQVNLTVQFPGKNISEYN